MDPAVAGRIGTLSDPSSAQAACAASIHAAARIAIRLVVLRLVSMAGKL
jgi:hypothetical protein